MPICRRLFAQEIRLAFSLDWDNAGNSKAARMAMMAITTSSSIKVNPLRMTKPKHCTQCKKKQPSDAGRLQQKTFRQTGSGIT
jgi:hypothetical protein